MDFSNWIFWLISIPSITILYLVSSLCQNEKIKELISKWGLCLLSFSLLGAVSASTLAIFLFVTLVAYVGCRYVQDATSITKVVFLWTIIPILLLPLIYYKYADFVFSGVLNNPKDIFKDLIIPIGISFYTFQVISFCVDSIKRNQSMPRFIDYINFCSFFPQIVAGPIERKDSLLPQMEAWRCRISADTITRGIPFVILGLFFKLALADNLATAMHVGYAGENAIHVWINNISFGFRIYFDFAGYGLSAYGVAKCLGVNITMNFMSPYTTCNVTEFWRKWHVSLTLWFRDYIYFSLGGSRTRFWWLNIIFMFLVSGIWHGAGWNFIIWGGLAGTTMVFHRMFRNTGKSLPPFCGWLLTMGTMMFIWMFFYETDMSIVWKNLCTITKLSCYNVGEFVQLLNANKSQGASALVFIPFSLLVIACEYISQVKKGCPYAMFLDPRACFLLILFISMLQATEQSQFIYFAF